MLRHVAPAAMCSFPSTRHVPCLTSRRVSASMPARAVLGVLAAPCALSASCVVFHAACVTCSAACAVFHAACAVCHVPCSCAACAVCGAARGAPCAARLTLCQQWTAGAARPRPADPTALHCTALHCRGRVHLPCPRGRANPVYSGVPPNPPPAPLNSSGCHDAKVILT
jgi:hypothetical protein